jgi:hypothetical protein
MNKNLKCHLLPVLALCLVLAVSRLAAQVVPDDNPQAKAIITAMQTSAEEWNKGDLVDFVLLYDPSATMMSLCLFPDTKGLYQNH